MTDISLPRPALGVASIARLVGFLVCVEITSGVLQGFYTPIFTNIAEHLSMHVADVNWFEAGQLVVSAIALPVLARMGDLVGHRQVLLLTGAVTALASWGVAVAPSFTTFLIAWSLQGFYAVWLPMEVSIIHGRTAGTGQSARLTRKATARLVAALEAGVIVGALASGALISVLPITVVLAIPAVFVTACVAVVWFGVESAPPSDQGRLDLRGFAAITGIIALLMGGLILIRLHGVTDVTGWVLGLVALVLLIPFSRLQLRTDDPLVDIRLISRRDQWPVQLTAFLSGMSVLGAQIPLSTFARTDPKVTGYGLNASASFVSVLIGCYVITMVVGALGFPYAARKLTPRGSLVTASVLVAVGYAAWIVLHTGLLEAVVNMCIIGVGSGGLVAALPATAASAAPADRTGFATGMTNTTKTLGGALASSIFAIALASTGMKDTDSSTGHSPLSGYITVWAVCAGTALLAAGALLLVPRTAFADTSEVIDETPDESAVVAG